MIVRSGKKRALDADVHAAAEIFKSLADPTRLRILLDLKAGERCVHELCAAMGASQTAMSHQLRTLRAARLVKAERQGREIFYSINDEHVMKLVDAALAHASEHA